MQGGRRAPLTLALMRFCRYSLQIVQRDTWVNLLLILLERKEPNMLRECSILEKEITDTLQSLYPLLETLTTLAGSQPELREYADIAFTCREVEDKLDDFLKRLRKVSYIAEDNAVKGMEQLGISKIVSHSCTATS